ncbi:hypothetical protein [Amorphus sp. MBR-141]
MIRYESSPTARAATGRRSRRGEVMTALKLNKDRRKILRDFADKSVTYPEQESVIEGTYRRALGLVRSEMAKRYPEADMEVLRHYKCAEHVQAVFIADVGRDRHVTFTLRQADRQSITRPRVNYGAAEVMSAETYEAVVTHNAAIGAHRRALDEKLTNYRRLIHGARTLEEVLDVWPAAAAVADEVRAASGALMPLSQDVRDFIASDNAGAPVQAA